MTERTDYSDPIYHDEDAARAHFEALRWEGGVPVCAHCGVVGEASKIERDEANAKAQKKAGKKVQRKGLYHCRACGKQFTATMGTIYEDSHIPLHKWMYATLLMQESKKGISALQLQRTLGLGSYRSAWYLAMRIREGMDQTSAGGLPPLGGEGKVLEADETYYGNVKEPRRTKKDGAPFAADTYRGRNRGPANKRPVVAVLERGGKARVFHVGNANRETVDAILHANADKASRLMTDQSHLYKTIGKEFASHETVNHSEDEFIRGDVYTNTVEGFFSVFKRGMRGVYQHCDEKYLNLYVKEFEFRHNHRVALGYSDKERATLAVKGVVGKRLTLRPAKVQQGPAS
jgi:transposase-like protein